MKNYQTTLRCCFVGYIIQAIVVNFLPLLFVTIENEYNIPLSKITILITVNFVVQLLTDVLSAPFINKYGYKIPIILSHLLPAVGFVLLAVLPQIMNPFAGFLIPVILYAIGGGLLEVLVSPLTEACPTPNKEKSMSLLHSFYCWGQMGVILVSTLFFTIFGVNNWRILSILFALVPVINIIVFMNSPIIGLIKEEKNPLSLKQLLCNKTFLLLLLLMICAGASELSVAQWASAFAESGLGLSKTLGDIAGPAIFAMLMGISRVFYGKYGEKIQLMRFIIFSVALCIFSYLLISLSPSPLVSLMGCALCGFSVGMLWPGTISTAAASIKNGGAFMFGLLALGGDIGCSLGPTFTGLIADFYHSDLKIGILAAIIFPVIMLLTLVFHTKHAKKN